MVDDPWSAHAPLEGEESVVFVWEEMFAEDDAFYEGQLDNPVPRINASTLRPQLIGAGFST